MPEKAHAGDWGYDVWATSEEEIAPGVWKYGLGFGLQVVRDDQLVDYSTTIFSTVSTGEEAQYEEISIPNFVHLKDSALDIAISIRPRSSIHKTGMVIANAPGTGDEIYTGEYCVIMYHVLKDLPRYKVGDKIAQIHLDFTFPMNFIEVEQLDETDRGEGGFGSTGKK